MLGCQPIRDGREVLHDVPFDGYNVHHVAYFFSLQFSRILFGFGKFRTSTGPELNSIALEELAVSFITETLEAIKLPAKPSAAAMKLELLTRQQQLEKDIAESKMLMARLTSAQTKEEKEDILRAVRERTRCISGC